MSDGTDHRIERLEAALAGAADGPQRLGIQNDLAVAYAHRYVSEGGADTDRVRAQELAEAVSAHPEADAEQRQRMALLLPVLTMVGSTVAAALRGHPRLDAEAMRRTDTWMRTMDPTAILEGLTTLQRQVAAIPDVDALPPIMRSMFALVQPLMELTRPGAGDEVSPEAIAALGKAAAAADPQVPGLDMITGLLRWMGPDHTVPQLEAALDGLAEDHLLTPLLRRDLATMLVTGPEQAGPDGLRRATRLLEQARAGMDAEHPLHDDTVRMLAGVLVSEAAADVTEESLDRARAVVAEVLGQARAGGSAPTGPDLFLRSLVGMVEALADDDHDTAPVVRDLVDAVELLPVDHVLRPVAIGRLGALLSERNLREGLLEDVDAADHLLGRAVAAVSTADAEGAALLRGVIAAGQLSRGMRTDDIEEVARAAAGLRETLGRLPDHHVVAPNLEFALALADLRIGAEGGPDLHHLQGPLDTVRRMLAAGGIPGVPAGVAATLDGAADVLSGLVDADPVAMTAAIERMEEQLTTSAAFPFQRLGQRALLGKSYLAAHDMGIDLAESARRAVAHLEEARRAVVGRRSGVAEADVLVDLAQAYRRHGDPAAARRTALDALAVRAGTVLLQTGVGHAVVTARGAATEAATLTAWCLADGDPAGAVQAVEMGRGMTLHAATSALAVPGLLRHVGHPELADAWAADAAARRDDPAPWMIPRSGQAGLPDSGSGAALDLDRAAADLRHEVLGVLRGTAEGRRLFTPPTTSAIAEALRAVDAHALVYLLPGGPTAGEQLLVVDRDGTCTPLTAATPGHQPVDVPVDFSRDIARPGATVTRAALDEVCAWAGHAVLEPVRAALPEAARPAEGDPLRMVMVPDGALGAVPWAAARLSNGRPACTEMVLSSAASARQFLEATNRAPLRFAEAPVLVADPTGGLAFAAREVLALRAAFYPNAVVLGAVGGFEPGDDAAAAAVGAGTPAEVLARLPSAHSEGASLLHLACHARAEGAIEGSHVVLTDRLTVREVLGHGAGRAVDAPGPLVVLSACSSDLTTQDYDEALTLATAFLAAGAVSVVGTKWPVEDGPTALVMLAFHHFLAAGSRGPADALRSAQLWMIDQDRRALPGMPEAWLDDLAHHDLADPGYWAAFVHHGR